jgi:hypothetical protein
LPLYAIFEIYFTYQKKKKKVFIATLFFSKGLVVALSSSMQKLVNLLFLINPELSKKRRELE